LKKPSKILIIIQRSNGDVFLSLSLINKLKVVYKNAQIDLLINNDTLEVAKLLPNINSIYTFSYLKKQTNQFKQEKNLLFTLFKKYDLSINLTASDRSVIYALLFGRNSISAIESDNKKSWWKRWLLTYYYYFDKSKHILLNNLQPLNLLGIEHKNLQVAIDYEEPKTLRIKKILNNNNISNFFIFHPSAQYDYKVYPKHLRDKLLQLLNTLEIPIIVTGSNSTIDLRIKQEIPTLPNIYNFIGETSLLEYFVLSDLALGYIGMDTLNMHIAASQNKRIFAIFGPTNLAMWSPWSNELETSSKINKPLQTYGSNTIFQADMSCVACGKAGCNDNHGKSECLYSISPAIIFNEIEGWFRNV
tara:strand:- start:318 stop:1397 length:1080 start_codon:yes stop_codon:yes gene_type:complete